MIRSIHVLLTNNDTAAFAQAYPNDGLKVVSLLQAWRPRWRYRVLDLPGGQRLQDLQPGDAVVITGSPASVNDDTLPWLDHLLHTIRLLAARQIPTLGLCFGHQAVARALGGRVDEHTGGWNLGLGVTHWHSPAPWMTPPASPMWLMAAHREQVSQMPPGARCLGSSDRCPVAAMALGEHVFTTQFHPEMPRGFMNDLLHFLHDKVPAPALAHARRTLHEQRESPAEFAQWMVRFIERAPASPSH